MDPEISGFKTEKGSVYTHLPDGRVQRFKTIENKLDSPSDSIIFIPDYDSLKRNYSGNKEIREYINKNMGSNEKEFNKFLENSVYNPNRFDGFSILDGKYNSLKNNHQINNSNELYLHFARKEGNGVFLPVNKNPTIGYFPFEKVIYLMREKIR